MKAGALARRLRIRPGSAVRLDRIAPDWLPPTLAAADEADIRRRTSRMLASSLDRLLDAQRLLWASDERAVLVILQGMDAAGKDGIIRHVMSGVNPQGCDVVAFAEPSRDERRHTFLWRSARAAPARGRIAIFNRSHYEDVLVVRVHPGLLPGRAGAGETRPDARFWRRRFRDINAFERHLVANGTLILKFFLHISRAEQRRRLLARLDDPTKHWKFSLSDLRDRAHWSDYIAAYEDALSATSTRHAPWHVIPADRKHLARAIVAAIIARAVDRMRLTWPEPDERSRAELEQARRSLLAEAGAEH
ncbi:MAG: polyphosphate kinase 2 family protein [Phycisphaeraceae bacterium]|nr:polyphosphate kinase 2 family protein [Phycisphaeraceae bacterium]